MLQCRVLIAITLFMAAPVVGQEIAWQSNYSQARQLAAEQRRLILLHFYTDNCEPCRVVDKQVFPDRNVVDAIEKNFIPVKLHERDNPELVRRYGVNRFPADVIVTHTGLPVHRGSTPTTARDYTLLLNNIALQSGVGTGRTAQANATSLLPPRDQMNQVQQAANQQANQLAAQSQQSATQVGNQVLDNAGQVANQTASTANQFATQAWQTANQTANQGYQAANDAATNAAGQVTQVVNGAADQATGAVNGYAARANSWVGNAANMASQYTTGAAGIANQAPQPTASQPPPTVTNPYTAQGGTYDQSPAPPAGYSPSGGSYGQPAPMATQPPPSVVNQPWQAAPQIPPVGNPPAQAAFAPGTGYAQQPSAAPAGPQMIPVNAAPMQGLEGYCPVTLIEKRVWRKGDVRFGAVHQGRTYLFAAEDAQKKFLADPDRFAPILSGVDAVQLASNGRTVDGRRDFGVVYRNQVYLFENAASRDAFEKAPDRFVGFAQQAMLRTEQKGTQLR